MVGGIGAALVVAAHKDLSHAGRTGGIQQSSAGQRNVVTKDLDLATFAPILDGRVGSHLAVQLQIPGCSLEFRQPSAVFICGRDHRLGADVDISLGSVDDHARLDAFGGISADIDNPVEIDRDGVGVTRGLDLGRRRLNGSRVMDRSHGGCL